MGIQAIVFDLDDTLFDSEWAYQRVLFSLNFNDKKEPYIGARERVKNRLGQGHVSARNRLLYFKEILESSGTYSNTALIELMDKYENLLIKDIAKQWENLKRSQLFQGLGNIPMLILTNENTRTQTLKLKSIDPNSQIFKKVVTSEDFGVEKPNLRLFEKTIENLNCKKSEILVVGDNYDTDLKIPFELGCQVVLTTEFSKNNAKVPSLTRQINSLNELVPLLREL